MITILILLLPLTFALDLANNSICDVASTIAQGAINYYSTDSPGEFEGVYWWISGVAAGSLLNYQNLCNDDQFESIIYETLIEQSGCNYNYEPSDVSNSIGNDDIGQWGLSVVLAAEMGFKSPEDGVSWLKRSENVFNLLWSRYDNSTCSGGLRWQFNQNSGYSYKATIANVNLFQLSARLYKLTGNSTYSNAAEAIYSWLVSVGFIDTSLEWGYEVFDGGEVDDSCASPTKILWTYNYGTLLAGTAYMYDATGNSDWETATEQIILGSQSLYNNTILYERACATNYACNDDQRMFKGIYCRFLGNVKSLVSSLEEKVVDLITPSSEGAARSCSGGSDGTTCGQNWAYNNNGVYYDGYTSLQEELSALEAVLALK